MTVQQTNMKYSTDIPPCSIMHVLYVDMTPDTDRTYSLDSELTHLNYFTRSIHNWKCGFLKHWMINISQGDKFLQQVKPHLNNEELRLDGPSSKRKRCRMIRHATIDSVPKYIRIRINLSYWCKSIKIQSLMQIPYNCLNHWSTKVIKNHRSYYKI